MKTVQEYLTELDKDRIINEYLYSYPINYEALRNKTDLSINEIREQYKTNLAKYINRLQGLQIDEDSEGKEYVLFAHKTLKDGFSDVTYSLICLQEFLEQGYDTNTYSYILSRQEEIVEYLVSDADYTQKNIYGLIANVLYEAAFFGYNQERLEEELNKLDEAIKELDEGNAVTYSLEEIEEMHGIEREKDTDEEELTRLAVEANTNYAEYCKRKELDRLKEKLCNNN